TRISGAPPVHSRIRSRARRRCFSDCGTELFTGEAYVGRPECCVLGSSNVSTPKTLARAQTGCARGRAHSAKSIDAAVAAATPASQCQTRAEQKPVGAHGLPSKDAP